MIFGIGLAKTGTTSLFAALAELGYRSGTYRHMRELGLDDWWLGDFSTDYVAGFDALTDLPLASFYVQLDQRYPGSKFILTVRDVDSWLRSVAQHLASPPRSTFGARVRLAAFGMLGFHEARFRRLHDTHVRDVQDYFSQRPESLLTLDIVGGEGWEKLCPFLDGAVPKAPFPHVQPGYRLPEEDADPFEAAGRTGRKVENPLVEQGITNDRTALRSTPFR